MSGASLNLHQILNWATRLNLHQILDWITQLEKSTKRIIKLATRFTQGPFLNT